MEVRELIDSRGLMTMDVEVCACGDVERRGRDSVGLHAGPALQMRCSG